MGLLRVLPEPGREQAEDQVFDRHALGGGFGLHAAPEVGVDIAQDEGRHLSGLQFTDARRADAVRGGQRARRQDRVAPGALALHRELGAQVAAGHRAQAERHRGERAGEVHQFNGRIERRERERVRQCGLAYTPCPGQRQRSAQLLRSGVYINVINDSKDERRVDRPGPSNFGRALLIEVPQVSCKLLIRLEPANGLEPSTC